MSINKRGAYENINPEERDMMHKNKQSTPNVEMDNGKTAHREDIIQYIDIVERKSWNVFSIKLVETFFYK